MENVAVWSVDNERRFDDAEVGRGVLFIIAVVGAFVVLLSLPVMAGQVHNVYAQAD